MLLLLWLCCTAHFNGASKRRCWREQQSSGCPATSVDRHSCRRLLLTLQLPYNSGLLILPI